MTEIYRHRARGAARHFAGLAGPAGAVAGRVAGERGLPLRVARVKGAVRSRRARSEPMRSVGRNVTIHIGRSNARTLIPGVLEMMADGRLQPQKVATLTAPVNDAVDALREHCRDDAIKTILTA